MSLWMVPVYMLIGALIGPIINRVDTALQAREGFEPNLAQEKKDVQIAVAFSMLFWPAALAAGIIFGVGFIFYLLWRCFPKFNLWTPFYFIGIPKHVRKAKSDS